MGTDIPRPLADRCRVQHLQQGKLNKIWSNFWTTTVSAPYFKVNWNCTTRQFQAGHHGQSPMFRFTKCRWKHDYLTARGFLNARGRNVVLKLRMKHIKSNSIGAPIMNHSSPLDYRVFSTSNSPVCTHAFFCAYRCTITPFVLYFNRNHKLN